MNSVKPHIHILEIVGHVRELVRHALVLILDIVGHAADHTQHTIHHGPHVSNRCVKLFLELGIVREHLSELVVGSTTSFFKYRYGLGIF